MTMTTGTDIIDNNVEKNFLYNSTTDAESELRLASIMGYPSSWRVMRVVPHPGDVGKEGVFSISSPDGVSRGTSFQDVIFAGDREKGFVDRYYNHVAAMTAAALHWHPEESTSYDQEGGQMPPPLQIYSKKDKVEVLWDEEEGVWYDAHITKSKIEKNDVRYTVEFKGEGTYQNGVKEDFIRLPKKKKPKKISLSETSAGAASKTKKLSNKSHTSSSSSKATNKKKNKGDDVHDSEEDAEDFHREEEEDGEMPLTSLFKQTKKSTSSNLSPAEIKRRKKFAKLLGFPSGWLATERPGSRYDIVSPENVRFSSKKKALESIGVDVDQLKNTYKKKASRRKGNYHDDDYILPSSKKKKMSKKRAVEQVIDDVSPIDQLEEEEGDPPWRRTGHEFLGQSVRHVYQADVDGSEKIQIGTVLGWLNKTDVDSNGEPAFLSETNGEPATLFHVSFKRVGVKLAGDDLLFADLEEFEIRDILIYDDDESSQGSIE
mmetsp:Transcript_42543/g.49726  ORF Transcript_42543/g.49726 Transcript_42543/m.49726 type:complete len:488 (-) Transcript_42543:263-1726(-)